VYFSDYRGHPRSERPRGDGNCNPQVSSNLGCIHLVFWWYLLKIKDVCSGVVVQGSNSLRFWQFFRIRAARSANRFAISRTVVPLIHRAQPYFPPTLSGSCSLRIPGFPRRLMIQISNLRTCSKVLLGKQLPRFAIHIWEDLLPSVVLLFAAAGNEPDRNESESETKIKSTIAEQSCDCRHAYSSSNEWCKQYNPGKAFHPE
jgi:hypothetical protein